MLPQKTKSEDNFQTPEKALRPLIKYLKKDWTIWECAEGNGNLTNGLRNQGFNVKGTDVIKGFDFLEYEPENYDCILTNPPFSLKQKFLERAYRLGKPFAFLLPLTTFETKKRQFLFQKYGLEVIFFDKRINFETNDSKGAGSWFATAWFTNGLNIGKQLNFESLLLMGQRKLND